MTTFRFLPEEREIFRLRPPMAVSAWAEANVVVKDGPFAGSRWRNDLTPYLAGIMDALDEPGAESVVVCGSPQTGKTRAAYNRLSYCIERRPGPKLLAMPNDDGVAKVLDHKLMPGLLACPATRKRFLRKSRSAIVFTDGTVVYLASAQSASDRASVSVQDLFLDEEDLYARTAGMADPVDEFYERTTSYSFKRKIFRISKPIGGEESSIWQALNDCAEIRDFHARCPACGAFQILRFDRIKFMGVRDPREMKEKRPARYECESCGYTWSDHVRDVAVRAGRWIARMSDGGAVRPRSIGFHLPSLISPFVSLSEIAADFLKARENPDTWPSFWNGRLAEPYRRAERETDEAKVLALRCDLAPRTVPARAVALTAGIDVQKRGFWFVVRAWAADLESWLVDYGFVPSFDAVAALVFDTRYPVENSGEDMGIWRAGMDSGGGETDDGEWSRTEEIYQFVRFRGRGVVHATKGASREQLRRVKPSPIDKFPRSGKPIPGGLTLYMLDSGKFKELLHARMEADHSQPFRLHAEAGEDYAAQIAAEKLVRLKKGSEWKRIRRDNHLLDCEVIAAACADMEWSPGLQLLARKRQAPPPTPAAENPFTSGRRYNHGRR